MAQPILCLIVPIGDAGGGPPTIGGGPIMPPPSIWPSPGHPAHPIAPGGGGGSVAPPIYIPPEVWPPPPADLPPGAVWPPLGVVVWIPGYGATVITSTGTPPAPTPS